MTPLVGVGDERLGLVPTLTLQANVPRNVFILLAQRFNAAYSAYSASKEDILLDAFAGEFAGTTLGKKVHLPRFQGRQLPDIDLLLESNVAGRLVVAEVKWQMSASTVTEFVDRNEYLKKGQRQLAEIRAFLEANPSYLHGRGLCALQVTSDNVDYLLLCKGHLGGADVIRPGTVMADYDVFVSYLRESTLSEALARVSRYEYLPQLGTDFILEDFAVRLDELVLRWKGLRYPELPPDRETEALEYYYAQSGKLLLRSGIEST